MARYPLNLPVDLKREAEQLAAEQGVSLNQFILWAVSEKVGGLKQQLDDPAFPHVTYRRGASGNPTPVVRGTGIRVRTIVAAVQEWALSEEQAAEEYGLSVAQVKGALSFAEAHSPEIAAEQALERASV